MIKAKGSIHMASGSPIEQEEFEHALAKLKDGKYDYYIFDDNANRILPQLKYLNGVVLKTISDQLPTHPPIGALYRYFEKEYAPLHICNINGQRFTYKDLKTEPSTEVSDVIESIIHHAQSEYGIKIPTMEDMKQAEAKELYAGAYQEDWRDYFNTSQNQ